jgi:hypothetical protein
MLKEKTRADYRIASGLASRSRGLCVQRRRVILNGFGDADEIAKLTAELGAL